MQYSYQPSRRQSEAIEILLREGQDFRSKERGRIRKIRDRYFSIVRKAKQKAALEAEQREQERLQAYEALLSDFRQQVSEELLIILLNKLQRNIESAFQEGSHELVKLIAAKLRAELESLGQNIFESGECSPSLPAPLRALIENSISRQLVENTELPKGTLRLNLVAGGQVTLDCYEPILRLVAEGSSSGE